MNIMTTTPEEVIQVASRKARVMGMWMLAFSVITIAGVLLAFGLAKDGKDAPRITEIGCRATNPDSAITIYLSDGTQYTAVCHQSNP